MQKQNYVELEADPFFGELGLVGNQLTRRFGLTKIIYQRLEICLERSGHQ